MSSPNHLTSGIKDAFSSNFPDFIPASPDYVPASLGKTYSSSSNSFGIVSIVSPTLLLFHDDPYMKKRGCSSSSTSVLPQDFEIEESSHKTNLERHEEQIEEILNHLDELSLDPELQQTRAQISKLQRSIMEITTELGDIINDMQIRHQADIENLQDSINELKNRME
ncbi:hypothetical protein Tco_0390566 [Tanacetum coccineum]